MARYTFPITAEVEAASAASARELLDGILEETWEGNEDRGLVAIRVTDNPRRDGNR